MVAVVGHYSGHLSPRVEHVDYMPGESRGDGSVSADESTGCRDLQ